MRGLAVLVACLPFVLLEAGLRVTGKPVVNDSTDDDPVVDLHQLKPLFRLNEQTGEYQIPESRRNFFQPASFAAQKDSNTKRVFVLGGSTVQGRPYAPETSFSTWLQLQLQAADASRKYEVVNCGGVSYASYRVARILDEVLGYQPDAIVLYTGHNEFLEDRSYAEVRNFSPTRIWISRIGASLHTVRWLQRALFDHQRALLPMEVDATLDHVGGLEKYHRDDEWRAGIQQHFDWTVGRMAARTQRQGVPLILCTPASDLVGTPPLKTEMLKSLRESDLFAFERSWQAARDPKLDPQQRLDAAQRCLQIDDRHAGAQFVAGRLLYEQGDRSAAKRHLTTVRDFDVCPLRATSEMIHSVRIVAEQYQLPLVDTIDLLDRRTYDGQRIPDQIPDPESFIDHVHPTIAGHQVIGAALAEQFVRLGWINESPEARRRYEKLARQHLDTLGEAYYARGKQRLEGLRRWATGRAAELGMADDPNSERD